jgi:hypothetical protein
MFYHLASVPPSFLHVFEGFLFTLKKTLPKHGGTWRNRKNGYLIPETYKPSKLGKATVYCSTLPTKIYLPNEFY